MNHWYIIDRSWVVSKQFVWGKLCAKNGSEISGKALVQLENQLPRVADHWVVVNIPRWPWNRWGSTTQIAKNTSKSWVFFGKSWTNQNQLHVKASSVLGGSTISFGFLVNDQSLGWPTIISPGCSRYIAPKKKSPWRPTEVQPGGCGSELGWSWVVE